jgi:hypothetical protein
LTSNLLLRSVGDYLHEKNHNNKPNEKFHQPISGDKLQSPTYYMLFNTDCRSIFSLEDPEDQAEACPSVSSSLRTAAGAPPVVGLQNYPSFQNSPEERRP